MSLNKRLEKLVESLSSRAHIFARIAIGIPIVFLFFGSVTSSVNAQLLPSSTSENTVLSGNSKDIVWLTECQAAPYSGIAAGVTNAVLSVLNGRYVGGETIPFSWNKLIASQCLLDVNPDDTATVSQVNEFLNGRGLVEAPFAFADTLYNNPPASGIVYAQQLVHKVTNPGEVYAATPYFPGLGFETLNAIQPAWSWMVNLVYGFMIIIILIIAFSILFQNAVGKQNIQLTSAIPNIILAMILVPLSYAISGFAIDFITIGANLVHGVMLSGPNALGANLYDGGSGTVKVTVGSGGENGADSILNFLAPEGGDDATTFNTDKNRGFYIDDPRVSVLRAFTLIDISNWGLIIDDLPGASGSTTSVNTFLNTTVCGVDTTAVDPADSPAGAYAITPPSKRDNLSCFLGQASAGIVRLFSGSTQIQGIGAFVADIVMIVLSFFMFFTGAILFGKLLVRYISIIFTPIMAPIVFASIAIPGVGVKAINWFLRTMYGSAFFYIITYAAIIFIVLLSQNGLLLPQAIPLSDDRTFVPPLMGFQRGGSDGEVPIISNGIILSSGVINFLLDLAAIALFFMLPRILLRLEKMFKFELDLSFLKDATAGFQQSRALASLTARTGYNVARGATIPARNALRRAVYYADTRAPLGTQGYVENRKSAAQTRARRNVYQQQSGTGLNRTWARTGGRVATNLRNRAELIGTGIDVSSVVPTPVKNVNWSFISANGLSSQTRIVIRGISGDTYYNKLEITKTSDEVNRLYGRMMVTNYVGKSQETNKIYMQAVGNETIKAVLTVNNGKEVDFDNGGKGSPSPFEVGYSVQFLNSAPASGQTFEVSPGGGAPYAQWYRPNPRAPQESNPRPLTIEIL